MLDQFLKKLKILNISKSSKILLALSGGVDSMVLMNLLKKGGFDFSIAHCNFCLRGKESDADQNFVEQISVSEKNHVFIKRFQTKKYAKENKISIQMAARKLRYDWFQMIKEKYSFNYIMTAHHSDDSIETFLINLMRGTGFLGLHGIKEINADIIRPLLNFNKKDCLQYAQDYNIDYREDSSNTDDKYVRNKIRNKIIPLMQEINPNVMRAIGSTISRVVAVENIYQHLIKEKKQNLVIFRNCEYIIDVKKLLLEPSPKQLLYEIISDFNFYDTESVFRSLFSSSGKEFFNANFYMVKDRDKLIISEHVLLDSCIIEKDVKMINTPFRMSFHKSSSHLLDVKKQSNNAMYINYSKLDFPLLIRPWKEGDRFMPLGMQSFKMVSDYFIDNKFSLLQKKKARLLISKNQIVCIIGERLDERFKLVEDSKKVYIVKI